MHRVQAIPGVAQALAALLGAPAKPAGKGVRGVDAVVRFGSHVFAFEWKGISTAGPVAMGIEQAKRAAAAAGRDAIPLLAVPFMGEVGRSRCEQAGVAWLDLSGNARICAPGLRIVVEGRPNRFKARGRPSSAFAPKSSRIARWLLMHPHQSISQRELAAATGLGAGFASRIVARLEEERLLVRDPRGALRPRDPDLLLDAWAERYDFSKHGVAYGQIAARSGEELAHLLAKTLQEEKIDYAMTGLAAAWFSTHFAGFRLVSAYLRQPLPPALLDRLGFREDPRGANAWLILPKDEGVFHGARERDGIRCVHPVQAYLDLRAHPERAKEAAERVRTDLLDWKHDA